MMMSRQPGSLLSGAATLVAFAMQPLAAQDARPYTQALPGSAETVKMVAIPGGKFIMGSPASEKNREADEGPQRSVSVSPFWMSATEITFGQWDAFFKDVSYPQSKTIDGVTRPTPQYMDLTWGMGRSRTQPANSMSQTAAIMFCQWLYAKTGIFHRLPTEAEWEYACKAGEAAGILSTPEKLKEYAVFKGNSDGKFQPVALKKANGFGLFDMLGNLSEWTMDQYDAGYYGRSPAADPMNPPLTRYPVSVRGGSYLDDAAQLRCSNRMNSDAKWNQRDPQIPRSRWWLTDGMFVGFRIVRPVTQPSKQEAELYFKSSLK
jgi:formylglycine-generating enzyme required for sulfatase activity